VKYPFTYEEVIEKINNARRFGNLPGVKVMETVLGQLGLPQQDIPFIHVAGTNGKGSVCAFLSAILHEAGMRTGTFVSPHLVEFEERITVDGRRISKEDVTRLGNMLLSADFGVNLTMFDYCLAMALLYFKEQGCDCLVMETGLGGRLDSTNALGNPAVAVITRIGFDHMAILGDTIEAIAQEKAGIIKPGVPLVVAPQESDAARVLKETYEHVNGIGSEAEKNLRFVQEADVENVKKMHLCMAGTYQWENGAAAMLAAEIFLENYPQETATPDGTRNYPQGTAAPDGTGICLRKDDAQACIRAGLENARWPGRMEILQEDPFLLVDGAHNSSGVSALAASLRAMYPGEKFHFIMGVMADKDYENMIEELLPLAISFSTYTPDSCRALLGSSLAACIRKRGIEAQEETDFAGLMASLRADVKNVAFGSLYFIGEFLKL
jgi:dihydrofolate synthase/folylpolyglutamate synthase